jgi:hypothetical protein
MPKIKKVIEAAERLGRAHGGNAAQWYWDRTSPELDDFRKVLKGIEDGDPAILDTFTQPSLSGEYADGMTPQALYYNVDATKKQIQNSGSEICDAYETGFSAGYEDAITDSCLEGMRRDVVFNVTVSLDKQKEDELLSKIVDMLSKENCELVYDGWEEA